MYKLSIIIKYIDLFKRITVNNLSTKMNENHANIKKKNPLPKLTKGAKENKEMQGYPLSLLFFFLLMNRNQLSSLTSKLHAI